MKLLELLCSDHAQALHKTIDQTREDLNLNKGLASQLLCTCDADYFDITRVRLDVKHVLVLLWNGCLRHIGGGFTWQRMVHMVGWW